MKKLLIFVILLFSISVNYIFVSAETHHKHDSAGMEQVFDHFMLSQFHDEISNAVRDYYKKDSIIIQNNWWDKKYDVVEVLQSEKGRVLSNSDVVKFTVLPYSERKQLGTDTITFGVDPVLKNKELNEKNVVAFN